MKKYLFATLSLWLLFWSTAFGIAPPQSNAIPVAHPNYGDDLRIEVWNDRGNGAVYDAGAPVTIYFKSNYDCYLTLYNIDTEGWIHLLYPLGPHQSNFISGGVIYSIPDGWQGFQFVVNGPAGIEYIAAVATYEPHPVPTWLRFHPSIRHSRYVGEGYFERITYDPYLAMDDIAVRIIEPCPGAVHYVQDFCSYYVSAPVYYPRYLCYNCHSHRRFRPYHDVCIVYEIWVDVDWVGVPVYVRKSHPRGFWKYRKRSKPYRARSLKDAVVSYPKHFQKPYKQGKNNIAFERRGDARNPAIAFSRPQKPFILTPAEKQALKKPHQSKKPTSERAYPMRPKRPYKDDNARDKTQKGYKKGTHNPNMKPKNEPDKPARPFERSDRALKPVPADKKDLKKKEVVKKPPPMKKESTTPKRSDAAVKRREDLKKKSKPEPSKTSKKRTKPIR